MTAPKALTDRTPLTTQARLGGYALILLVVLAAGFGLGRAFGAGAAGRDGPVHHGSIGHSRHSPAPHTQHMRPLQNSLHTEEQPS